MGKREKLKEHKYKGGKIVNIRDLLEREKEKLIQTQKKRTVTI